MGKRITIKDIVQQLNVSISKVSKALNDSDDTKELVKQYAAKHKYRSNKLALSLLNKRTKAIAVITPNILNNFFSKVFAGIEEVATNNGYTLISCISNESYNKEVKTIDFLNNESLEGLIVSIAEEIQLKKSYEHFQKVIDQGIELVLFNRVTDKVDCDKIVDDDFDGAYNATKDLLHTGCKNVAVISLIDSLNLGKLRVEGYKKAILESNKKLISDLIIHVDKTKDFNTQVDPVFFKYKIDGLLCLEEKSVLKSSSLVKSKGYRIPDDISIVCFTNGQIPRYITPSITTISQHAKQIVRAAASKLITRLENPNRGAYSTEVIKASFIERE
ncbi:LacI family DNA-binding transcriptional regulator [Aquimarina algiphila]|uniref:LacI family DNA-binding transcriptional regulator n=1 Tax=Aquimarina algiphila TaxID=2047982 RepID=UPI002493A499|nr:LacI family DNA-binding transcriptional regulator [Aquimarina algiphila]